jgi:NADH-quinone oxidoreductase subunit L
MPITYWTCLIGALALIGFPGFSGFYSKDALIEAVHEAWRARQVPFAGFAYACVLLGAFVTALYTFRLMFMTFHGSERMDQHTREHLHESPWVIWVPLVLLAIPSLVIGAMTVGPVLFGGYFHQSILVLPQHDVLARMGEEFRGPLAFIFDALKAPTVYLALAGVATAWLLYLKRPELPALFRRRLAPLYNVLDHKYYFDWFNEHVIAAGARAIGRGFWQLGDRFVIDGVLVNGSARSVDWLGAVIRHLQSGYLYHYAFAMIIGLSALLAYLLVHS